MKKKQLKSKRMFCHLMGYLSHCIENKNLKQTIWFSNSREIVNVENDLITRISTYKRNIVTLLDRMVLIYKKVEEAVQQEVSKIAKKLKETNKGFFQKSKNFKGKSKTYKSLHLFDWWIQDLIAHLTKESSKEGTSNAKDQLHQQLHARIKLLACIETWVVPQIFQPHNHMELVPLVIKETTVLAREFFLETHQPRTESWMQIATTKVKDLFKFGSKLAHLRFDKSI